MDANRFDSIAKALIGAASRRAALAAALGGSFGVLGVAQPDETAAGGRCKPMCGECQTCKKGTCRKTPRGKRCKRGKCQPKDDGTACTAGTCQGGVCTDRNTCTNNLCPPTMGPSPCGPAGSSCVCYGAVPGSGVCVRDDGGADLCPTGVCGPGLRCLSLCGTQRCFQPCV